MIGSLQKNSPPSIWQVDTDSSASLFHQELSRSHSIDHFITSAVPETQDIVLFAQKATWEILQKFNADTARLHLLLTSYAAQQAKPWEGGFRLFGTSLLKELNWQKRKTLSTPEKLDRIAHAVLLLSNLKVKLLWNEVTPNCGIDYTQMWHVPLIREYGESNSEGEIDEPHNLVLAIKPGAWTDHFYNKQSSDYYVWMCQEILKIDTRTSDLPLRLAVFLFMDSHRNFKGEYRLRHLIKEVLPQVYVDKLHADRRKNQEFRRQLDQAFTALYKLGWTIEGYGGESIFEHLLASWISIRPPVYTSTSRAKEADPNWAAEIKQSKGMTGDELKEFRKSQNWSQDEFADLLGVSQELVSKLERGTCGINRSLEQMIRDWRDLCNLEVLN